MKKISIVVPCYNEEENVVRMAEAVRTVMSGLPQYDYENIFIDNCSTDSTAEKLRQLAREDRRIKVILNNRNFGPECSGMHALLQASGDAVIGIACDFQDPPEMIPAFIEKWEQGAKVVFGQKKGSGESGLMYRVRSLYYVIIRRLSSVPQYDHVTGFGLLDKKVIREMEAMRDPWPMTRNMIPALGYVPELIPYVQRARERGKSSYNLFSYFNTALSSLVHTSKVPLKLAIWIGLFFSLLSFLVGCFYLGYKLLFWDSFSVGQAPLVIMVSFIASLQLVFLGLLGEYVLAILDRVSFSRYVIEKECINFDS